MQEQKENTNALNSLLKFARTKKNALLKLLSDARKLPDTSKDTLKNPPSFLDALAVPRLLKNVEMIRNAPLLSLKNVDQNVQPENMQRESSKSMSTEPESTLLELFAMENPERHTKNVFAKS
jgi:hypothetical protein